MTREKITSGKGPAECERVVAKVLEKILRQARSRELDATLIESVKGKIAGTQPRLFKKPF